MKFILPKDLNDIIIDYKEQLEHTLKFQKTLDKINNITYQTNHRESWRTHESKTVNCYGGLNCANLMRNSIHELWIHTFTKVDGNFSEENEIIKIIYEDRGGLFIETCNY